MNSLMELVGHTPTARIECDLPSPQPGFIAKLESLSIGGMKARAAVSMLQNARIRGELEPGARVVESTSGTLGVGLAFAACSMRHPLTLVVDADLEPSMLALLTAYGAAVEVVDRPHPTGGWQEARRLRVQEVLRQYRDSYWTDQYNNPDNVTGYASLAEELVQQVPDVDVLVCSVGTGGHSAGIVRAARRHWPGVRLIGVDSVGSTIFGQPARARLMRGLGSSIYPRNVAYREFDEVHWVGPLEAVATCRRLARSATIAGGWSTGAAALVAAWTARVEPGARVVTIFPDGPHRYLGTIYDDAWCHHRNLLGEGARSVPVEIADPAHLEVSGWSRTRCVRDPLEAA